MPVPRELKRRMGDLTYEDLAGVFHLPLPEAAKELGIGSTALKRVCRKQNIPRWPFRRLRSLDTLIRSVNSDIKRSNDEAEQARLQIDLKHLQRQRESVMNNPSILLIPQEEMPSKQKSSTAGSAASGGSGRAAGGGGGKAPKQDYRDSAHVRYHPYAHARPAAYASMGPGEHSGAGPYYSVPYYGGAAPPPHQVRAGYPHVDASGAHAGYAAMGQYGAPQPTAAWPPQALPESGHGAFTGGGWPGDMQYRLPNPLQMVAQHAATPSPHPAGNPAFAAVSPSSSGRLPPISFGAHPAPDGYLPHPHSHSVQDQAGAGPTPLPPAAARPAAVTQDEASVAEDLLGLRHSPTHAPSSPPSTSEATNAARSPSRSGGRLSIHSLLS